MRQRYQHGCLRCAKRNSDRIAGSISGGKTMRRGCACVDSRHRDRRTVCKHGLFASVGSKTVEWRRDADCLLERKPRPAPVSVTAVC